MVRFLAMALLALAACGPAVASDEETDGGAGSGDAGTTATVGSSESGSTPLPACTPTVEQEHGSVPRSQLASSLAAVLCIAQEDCCPGARPSSSCRHGMNMDFEVLDALAVDLGLAYDGDCAGLQQAAVIELGCGVVPPEDITGLGACSIYFGDGVEGASCDTVGTLGSTCGRGLACAAGFCLDPCTALSTARPYVYGYACAPGQVPSGYECRTATFEGQECSDACADGLYCPRHYAACAPDCVGVCRLGEPVGSTCAFDEDCRDAVCVEGTCAVGQPEGAACLAGCGVGLSCDAHHGTCVRTPTVCLSTAG